MPQDLNAMAYQWLADLQHYEEFQQKWLQVQVLGWSPEELRESSLLHATLISHRKTEHNKYMKCMNSPCCCILYVRNNWWRAVELLEKFELELHFLTCCSKYALIRDTFYPHFTTHHKDFHQKPNMDKLPYLLGESPASSNLAARYVRSCHDKRPTSF